MKYTTKEEKKKLWPNINWDTEDKCIIRLKIQKTPQNDTSTPRVEHTEDVPEV